MEAMSVTWAYLHVHGCLAKAPLPERRSFQLTREQALAPEYLSLMGS